MEYCGDGRKRLYRILSIIYIILCALIFIILNIIISPIEELEDSYFVIILIIDITLVARCFICIMILMKTISSCCMCTNFFVIIAIDIIALGILLGISSDTVEEGDAGSNILLVFLLIFIALDIILLIPFCKYYSLYKDTKDFVNQYYKNEHIKLIKTMAEELEIINPENIRLKEENKKLIALKNELIPINIKDKQIEIILWYFKKYYEVNLPSNLYKNFLDEINQKYGITIDNNIFKNIFLKYIKEKFIECLTCPLTANIFTKPVITPDGQTFDKNDLLKEIQSKGKNPITKNKLSENQLISNKLVQELSEIIKNNEELKIEILFDLRKFLISPYTREYFTHPYVVKDGPRKGENDEKNNQNDYSNKVILNIIEKLKKFLTDEFLNSFNEKGNLINNIDIKHNEYNNEEINSVIRFNLK